MLSRFLTRLIVLLFGILRPSHATYKAFISQQDLNNWTKYWIVTALLICIEAVTDLLIFWLPFYYVCKMLLVVWLVLTVPRGNIWIFDVLVHPLLSLHEIELELVINEGKKQILIETHTYMGKVLNWNKRNILPIIVNAMHDKLSPMLIADMQNELKSMTAPNKMLESRLLNVDEESREKISIGLENEEKEEKAVEEEVISVNLTMLEAAIKSNKDYLQYGDGVYNDYAEKDNSPANATTTTTNTTNNATKLDIQKVLDLLKRTLIEPKTIDDKFLAQGNDTPISHVDAEKTSNE